MHGGVIIYSDNVTFCKHSFTLGCIEREVCGLVWAESAVRIGCYHNSVLCLSLESRYLCSSVCLSGDNDTSICPRHLICVAPSTTGRWR